MDLQNNKCSWSTPLCITRLQTIWTSIFYFQDVNYIPCYISKTSDVHDLKKYHASFNQLVVNEVKCYSRFMLKYLILK